MQDRNENFVSIFPPHALLYQETVRRALLEDLGNAGDITTDALVSKDDKVTAKIVARASGRVAGLDVAACAFHCLDPNLIFETHLSDGQDARPGDTLAVIRGHARPILTAERTALNFLMRLSGVATATRDMVKLISSYPARIVCTRKTTPGLRALEKYAVRVGGGANHRFGLDDAILIKDNHIIVAGGVTEAIRRVQKCAGHLVKIEVEVDTLEQLEEALQEGVDAILLDNMPIKMLAEAVQRAKGKAITEASGGVTPENVCLIAATGVDLISIGWITHSTPALNLALELAVTA